MKIAMIGTGYVGLVSGACFAEFGLEVVGVDKDATKIRMLEEGKMPIYEPGLDDLVAANVRAKRLSFTTGLKGPVAEADAVFIAVGTPSRRGDGHADLTYVYAAAKEIAALRRGEIPIFEPGLDTLVASNVKAKRLDFTTDLTTPVAEADAVFIAVGTPSRRGDGHADLTYVYSAAREIAAALSGFTVVITKSTCLLYTSPSPRDGLLSRMPSSA